MQSVFSSDAHTFHTSAVHHILPWLLTWHALGVPNIQLLLLATEHGLGINGHSLSSVFHMFCSLCMGSVARTRLALLELQGTRTFCMCMTQSSLSNRCACLLVCIHGLHDVSGIVCQLQAVSGFRNQTQPSSICCPFSPFVLFLVCFLLLLTNLS